jgi:hypothetical protein
MTIDGGGGIDLCASATVDASAHIRATRPERVIVGSLVFFRDE